MCGGGYPIPPALSQPQLRGLSEYSVMSLTAAVTSVGILRTGCLAIILILATAEEAMQYRVRSRCHDRHLAARELVNKQLADLPSTIISP